MGFLQTSLREAWYLLLDSSVYILFGLLVSGLVRVFLSPHSIAKHFSKGKISSVFKAALLGIPLPLCSCGVLPAAVGLRKQGANKGATAAFLISTPESGIDSVAVSYALLDPFLTVSRPVAAFTTAVAAGVTENMTSGSQDAPTQVPDLSCPVDGCCDGSECPPDEHKQHHSFFERMIAGLRFSLTDVWGDMAGWFFLGLVLAGMIGALIPPEVMTRYLGGGLSSMLIMLALGIPLYTCATASTPIAAALILKGVSPGAALVFLLAGPATNITSLTVLFGILGKKAAVIYLTTIAGFSVAFGLLLDAVYRFFSISPQTVVGKAGEMIPLWAQWGGAVFLLLLSVGPLKKSLAVGVRKVRSLCGRHQDDKGKVASVNEKPGVSTTPT
jgi:uncharacterized membrane protein YraQ (UPF0718 family)